MGKCGLCVALMMLPPAIIFGLILADAPRKFPATTRKASDSEVVQPDMGTLGSGAMFNGIAGTYDLANRMMSLGQDQTWRSILIDDCLNVKEGDVVLDLATGTADVALMAATKVGQGKVIGVDPAVEMLRVGHAKINNTHLPISLYVGDAQDLSIIAALPEAKEASIEDASVNKIAMAFGIRNVPNRMKALIEMRRVLKRDQASRVCILEFSMPDGTHGTVSKFARFFVENGVPVIGYLSSFGVGGAAYRYLERSIHAFPTPDTFAAMMNRAGLEVLSITHMAHGVVQLYSAQLKN